MSPPHPDNFPDGWELTSAVMAAVADHEAAIDMAEKLSTQNGVLPPTSAALETSPASQLANPQVDPENQITTEIGKEIGIDALPSFLVAPSTSPESEKVKMVTIILRSTQDKVRDNLRIRQIYGTLIAYPGKDRFAFHVFERSRGYLIEFPNFTTRVCPELLSRLKPFILADEVRVEEITFQ
jgi:hypothetical protein